MSRLTDSPAWQTLLKHHQQIANTHMRDLFAGDPQRFERFSVRSVETAKAIMAKAGDRLMLPVDAVAAEKFEAEAACQIVDVNKVPLGWRVLDIGPRSIEQFGEVLKTAKLVVWNGPLSVFEFPKFAEGTFAIAKLLANTSATTVIGGGDSASAVKKAGVAGKMTHVSTGGGASLEFLEGRILPGGAALNDNK